MSRVIPVMIVLSVAAVLAVLRGTSSDQPAEKDESLALSAKALRHARVFEIASHDPELSRVEIQRFIEQSDHIREQVEENGEEGLGFALRQRLQEVEVSDEEATVYFHSHRDIFGRRSFEESRFTIQRLVAIQRVRAEFGL